MEVARQIELLRLIKGEIEKDVMSECPERMSSFVGICGIARHLVLEHKINHMEYQEVKELLRRHAPPQDIEGYRFPKWMRQIRIDWIDDTIVKLSS